MESSAGPISADILAEWIWEAHERPGGREPNLLPTELAAFLMRRIAPLIQAARAEAAAEMRERCAVVADGEFVSYHDAANKIRALPLSPTPCRT